MSLVSEIVSLQADFLESDLVDSGEPQVLADPPVPGVEGVVISFKIYLFIYLFYFWLCWVFVSVRGLSLVVASGGHSSSWCAGLSLLQPHLLRSTGSRRAGSVIVAHGPSCSAACGLFPDQGSNPCPLHWQADSQPLRHQRSPELCSYVGITQTHWASFLLNSRRMEGMSFQDVALNLWDTISVRR